jgi:hypothetical protein
LHSPDNLKPYQGKAVEGKVAHIEPQTLRLLTCNASCNRGTSLGFKQVARPLGHWLLRRPARPAICLIWLTLTGTRLPEPAA